MIIGSALKLVPTLKSNPMGVPVCAVIACAVFALVALLRWPLVWVLLGIGIVACCYAAMQLKSIAAMNKPIT